MEASFSLVATFVLTIILLFLFKKSNNKKGQLKSLPGPSGLPFFGCILQIQYLTRKYKLFNTISRICKKYGPVSGIQLGLQYTILVEDPETAKQILNSDDWPARNPSYSSWLKNLLDKEIGLMFNYGEGWRENRRFVLRTLRDVGFGLRNQQEIDIADELQYFMKTFEEKRIEGNEIVSMHRVFKLSSLNLLWRVLTGERTSDQDENIAYLIGKAEEFALQFQPGGQWEFAFPFLKHVPKLTILQDQIDGMTMLRDLFKEIAEKKLKDGSYKTNPNDFIDHYLKKIEENKIGDVEHPIYNYDQLLQSCADMFLAGADTTGDSLEFAIMYMMRFPKIQRKVQAELDSVLKNGESPLYRDVEFLPYTQAFIYESARYSTITPIIPRTCITDTTINGCHIPKDTVALINFHKINRSEKVFGDPEVFRPERFLDEDGNLRKESPGLFLQFGLGKRVCVGQPLAKMSFFTFFTNFFQRYTVEPSPQHPNVCLDSSMTGVNNQPVPYTCIVKRRIPNRTQIKN